MKSQKSQHTKHKIPQIKIKEVESLENLIKKKKTILIASIKNIPASQFQEISKKLRGKATIKVPKKSLIIRAIEHSKNEKIKELENQIQDSTAILFSDLDSFELAAELIKNKTPAKAKPGQIAPMDIEIPEGPTELVPGPAISELGALGIQIQIEKGKIHIKTSKIVAKKGDKITQAAADVMAKLDIKPFTIGLIPVAAYDSHEGKIYLEINIDTEKTLEELKSDFGKALAFVVGIGYFNKETIPFILAKAARHEKTINSLIKHHNQTPEVDKTEGESQDASEDLIKSSGEK